MSVSSWNLTEASFLLLTSRLLSDLGRFRSFPVEAFFLLPLLSLLLLLLVPCFRPTGEWDLEEEYFSRRSFFEAAGLLDLLLLRLRCEDDCFSFCGDDDLDCLLLLLMLREDSFAEGFFRCRLSSFPSFLS